uniref:amidohydrolase family protein n=1 Tax=Actinomadura sp. CA-154981 TaxID=3240037 RepID=UPI003F490EE9
MGFTRRKFLLRSGQATAAVGGAWFGGGLPGESPALASAPSDDAAWVVVTEATNASAALSPNGKVIAFDLLNLLWTVPVLGGEATRLTRVEREATEPDFSPDGKRVVFTSYTDGNFHLWLMNTDGSGQKQLTFGKSDQREPRFSPDGRHIAFSGEHNGRYAVQVLSVDDGSTRVWTQGTGQEGQPVWAPDGTALAFTTGPASAPRSIDLVDAAGTRRTLATVTEGKLAGPSFSLDGKRLAYVHITLTKSSLIVDGVPISAEEEDVFPFSARWMSSEELLYTADGRLRRRMIGGGSKDIPFTAGVKVPVIPERRSDRDFDSAAARQVKGIVGPAPSPDGTKIAFAALGDIWIAPTGKPPKAVISDGHHNTAPAWSHDGRTLVYASDRTGSVELWLHHLGTGQQRQLTNLDSLTRFTSMAPTFSPDGRLVAFVLNEDTVHTVDVATGAVRKVVGPLRWPGPPSFSADGKRLAVAALVPITPRFREGRNQILTVDLDSGRVDYTEPLPGLSLGNRIDAGPVYSPDGKKIAYIVGGVPWISGVDTLGRPTGTARKLSDETADAPRWSGDSRSLIYMSNGRLRTVDTDGGAARPVPVRLTWRPAIPSGRMVIRAGALWDGRDSTLRRNVDITVENNRITTVSPGGAVTARPGDQVIDARDLTVMPGMIAAHEHGPWLRNDLMRLWLSFGITAIRTPETEHYRAVEAKEAIESGRRPGPRIFSAGGAIEGPRTFYPGSQPINSPADVLREIEKARALGHDMVKTYVRLPYALQHAAIKAAHGAGLRTSSHYLFGPMTFGGDGIEHIGGTSRYGRGQKETNLGYSYQDMTEPLIQSRMAFTPTLGLSGGDVLLMPALYRHAAWALGDPRMTKLLSAKEYEGFRTGVEAATAKEPVAELALVKHQTETVRRLIERGAQVAVGTDSPLAPFAIYYHLNLQAMVRYGITPITALRAATSGGARTLGLSAHLGTVERGKLADLVLVKGNPLEDITAAAAVRQVIVGGRVYKVSDLVTTQATSKTTIHNTMLPEVPQAPTRRFWWHNEDTASHACC